MVKLITIDGPGGVGKGTASRGVAAALDWRLLDSGALYRLVALLVIRKNIAHDDVESIVTEASNLDVVFDANPHAAETQIYLEGDLVADEIRTEACGKVASIVSAHAPVRAALMQRQRDFLTGHGLVADGRDMGTVVFPEALLKVFLSASVEVRADRRHKQLLLRGVDVNIADLRREIAERDARDINRIVAPLVPAEDAVLIDTSVMSIREVQLEILKHAKDEGLCER